MSEPYNKDLINNPIPKPVPIINNYAPEEFALNLRGPNGELALTLESDSTVTIHDPDEFSKFLRILPPTQDQVIGSLVKAIGLLQQRLDKIETALNNKEG